MKLPGPSPVDLTYCTNVHPGETWEETLASLKRYLPAVKARVSPDQPFGVGLRLSGEAAQRLAAPRDLDAFKAFLAEAGLYVFTINGFPYGRFHGTRVKEAVYLPDWRDESRLAYTNRLADILGALLPDGRDIEGSISTVPGAFKPLVKDQHDIDAMVHNLVRHAMHLADIEERTGRTLRLALEPEPCCFLETIEEAIGFFETHLFSSRASENLLRRHLGICFDVCHAAVEFEEDNVLDRLVAAGIAVPKIQISAALRLPKVDGGTAELLRPFDDGVYFHQVVERSAGGLTRYFVLDEAFAALNGDARPREWRVHFHVPVFREALGGPLRPPRTTLKPFWRASGHRRWRRISKSRPIPGGVLPDADRHGDLATNIAREIEWARRELTD